jgi:ABC-type antimicrobial peptide transport system permease subunit
MMQYYYVTVRTAYRGIFSKKSRTFLTLLGISIGIGSVMLIASLGAGTRDLIVSEISSLGADMIAIQPGRDTGGGGFSDIASRLYGDTLKQRDVDALSRKENVPYAARIEPIVLVSGSVSFEENIFYPQIIGSTADFYEKVFNIFPIVGEMHTDIEQREKASVAVIGSTVKEELFGERNALGERITIKGRKFRIIGVLPPTGQKAFMQVDTIVIIPYTTALTYLSGNNHFNEIIVVVSDPSLVPQTKKDIEYTLRDVRNFNEGDENDFVIRTPSALMKQIDTILLSLTLFLTGVVAIALIVGGIGIMNSMLVSVTERTKEIGLRKAVGAKDKDILLQFLLEAVGITFLGGVIGIFFGIIFSYGIGFLILEYTTLSWNVIIPLPATLYALLSSVGIGLIFGAYPAYSAAQKTPIDALRYE